MITLGDSAYHKRHIQHLVVEGEIIRGDKIDACLVGTTTDKEVIVAFRGTLMPKPKWSSFLDWLQDFLAFPEPVPGLPGKVHIGFYFAVLSIWNQLLPEVKKQAPNGAPVTVTVMVPLNGAGFGETVAVNCAVFPAVTLVVPGLTAIAKSGTLPAVLNTALAPSSSTAVMMML